MEMILKADNKDIKIHIKDIDNGKEGGVGCGVYGLGRGRVEKGRHEAQAPSNQVKNYKQTWL